MDSQNSSHAARLAELGVSDTCRHAFVCIGPECCQADQGQAVWETLKASIKAHEAPALRTKAACLRLCEKGPWMVVYPEGVWYGQLTPERCETIVSQHLKGGVPVEAFRVRPQAEA